MSIAITDRKSVCLLIRTKMYFISLIVEKYRKFRIVFKRKAHSAIAEQAFHQVNI